MIITILIIADKEKLTENKERKLKGQKSNKVRQKSWNLSCPLECTPARRKPGIESEIVHVITPSIPSIFQSSPSASVRTYKIKSKLYPNRECSHQCVYQPFQHGLLLTSPTKTLYSHSDMAMSCSLPPSSLWIQTNYPQLCLWTHYSTSLSIRFLICIDTNEDNICLTGML